MIFSTYNYLCVDMLAYIFLLKNFKSTSVNITEPTEMLYP